jgi:hypothetical protein
MMVLPTTAQRWMVHHPVLPVMVLVAATIATAQVGGPILVSLAWVPALCTAGIYMGIEHSALRRHDPETCLRCDESVADRHATVLRRYHRLARPVLVVGGVVTFVLVAVTSAGVAWGWRLTGLVLPPAVWMWIAYGLLRYVQSTHIRLRPWCPWCRTPTRPARTRQSVH